MLRVDEGKSTGKGQAVAGYYGQPVLKAPVWTWEIPIYFFVGGLAGMAALIAAVSATFFGSAGSSATDIGSAASSANEWLIRDALRLAFAGCVVSPLLLISDLGRPRRFLNMVRTINWRSPLSVGVWILILFSALVTAALLIFELVQRGFVDLPESVSRWLLLAAAAFGIALATYTGVLLGATAIPVWARHHRMLPFHFAASSLGSAAGALLLLGHRSVELALVLGASAIFELLLAVGLELGADAVIDAPLRHGSSGRLVRSAALLSGPAALGLLIVEPRVAAVSFLAGSLASRWGWAKAGSASAADPRAAL